MTRFAAGLGFALLSACSFGLSGALGKGLMSSGWSPGAVVLLRIVVGGVVLLPPTLLALRGRWWLARRNAWLFVTYGAVAIAGCQLAYFTAIQHLQVGVALLVEYTAPVAVVLWLWARHAQRPRRLTVVGAVVCAVGLVLVLDVLTGGRLSVVGVLWALVAMLGAAAYFVLSAQEDNGLPAVALAGGGIVVGAAVLGLSGLVGLVPMRFATDDPSYGDLSVPWWLPILLLGAVTAALAYWSGIAASRRLGSRLASFVALTEVLAALVFAWLLLGELPRAVQFLGGACIVVGVVVVKLGERDTAGADAVEGAAAPVSGHPGA
ncbi:MAG TPA: DMT family transporter [Marmoricola sp.]|jgi:drug/metabolite transporter (DMT)-like permease|nr:DMT family transporter [Marmoricola sp.]